ncbi:MAG: hypothetical protein FJ386_08310 [Verrucomicrobia bacterium]|nr:hypothetical protein [Verrucomicrobiota bacterium]
MSPTKLLAAAAILAAAVSTGAEPQAKPAEPKSKPVSTLDLFPDKVLARSTNITIKASKVEEEFAAMRSAMAAQGKVIREAERLTYEKRILEHFIVTELLLIKADDADRAKAGEKVTAFLDEMRKRVGSEEALRRQVESTGAIYEVYKGRLLETAIAKQVLTRDIKDKIQITTGAAQKFYDDNPSRFETPEMVRASHILISTRDPQSQLDLNEAKRAEKRRVAEGLLERARKGEDFAKLVKDFSDDAPSKDKGGEYVFPRGMMAAEFEAAAFTLGANQVSDLVTTKVGFHIIKVAERIPARKTAFDRVQENIREFLSQQEADKQLPAYVEKLKKAAGVEYLDERLKP